MPSAMEVEMADDGHGMEHGTAEEESAQNVCVAIMIRPFLQSELGSKNFLRVDRGQEVTCDNGSSKHQFTYDAVFGENGLDSRQLYPKCVHALVDGLFRGYNATVFAYGQTGSGKTYTMGSEYKPGHQSTVGVIPDAITSIFSRIEASRDWQCTVRVGFVEIHKEEVRDLLVTTSGPRPAVSIRESPGGGVCLYGATEIEVRSKEEMAAVLEMGTLCRATASTGMNDRSSRSHAIFTITLEQRRQISGTPGPENNGSSSARGTRTARTNGDDDDDEGDDTGADGDQGIDDYLCAKMHLVDLAGSERAKRTKAEGARLKEGIHINRGLLSLGNVINAIVDNHKHIPYRDSKLTRLLQDSLGGNSRTVMIACVSPADVNYDETLNTLRYADRARHIRNKPKINRDPIAAQVAHLRQMLSQARNDNEALKRALAEEGRDMSAFGDEEGGGRWAYVQQLQQEKSALELSNTRLTIQMEDLRKELAASNDRMYSMQAELELAKASGGGGAGASSGIAPSTPTPNDGAAAGSGAAETDTAAGLPKHDVLKAHIMRIAELEKELHNFRQFQSLRRRPTKTGSLRRRSSTATDGMGGDAVVHGPATPNGANSPSGLPATGLQNGVLKEDSEEGDGSDSGSEEGSRDSNADEEMFYAEMAAHAFEQEKLKQDMLALQRMLETKERKMADINKNTGQVPALRQQYDRVLVELQKERDMFMAEKAAIMQKLQQLQASSEEERRKLEAQYKEKLKNYDEKLRDVRRKEREFINMQKLKMRTEEMCSRLNADIHRIKLQKVALQKTMEGSAKQFAQWRAEREKELMQLRKQNRRNTAQIQSLEAMQAKQNAVLQRKIADAAAARKKLKELQAASKEGSHGLSTAASVNGSLSASMSGRPGTANNGNGNANSELQPNAQAPLLRNEKARREWVEMELDNCNLSYEYRRVLDGELAQRAEANRLLKEVEKRLMIAKDLVPASPLIPSGSCRPPLPPANLEGRARLMERKAQLEAQVREHNQQILELQAAFEKAKQEEENRGGGAADAKRWTGVRNAIEARELLRTVFRIACDHKALSNEAAIERAKLLEEIELMKVQLDSARKEVEAQHKRCAAIEASAANVMASPYNGGTSHPSNYRNTTDEMDTECDDLLQQLQVVAQSPARPLPDVAAGDEVALASPDTSVQNSMEFKTSGSRAPLPPKGSRLDLSQAASQLMRCSMAPQSGVQGPGSGRYAGMSAYDQDTIKGAPEEEEEEYMETDTAEEMDDLDADDTEWDPAHPTPPRGNSRKNTLNSNSSKFSSGRHTGGSSSGRRRCPARPTILDPNTFSIPAMVAAASSKLPGQAAESQPQASRGSQRQANGDVPPRPSTEPSNLQQGPLSHRVSISDIGSVASSVATLPQNEGLVLEDVNNKRAAAGEDPVNRLTVKLLKDALAGSVGPDGKQWRAGNKTREQLLRDYHIMLGQASDATSSGPPSSMQGPSQQPQADSVPSSSLPPPSVLSPPQPLMDTNGAPTQSAPRHQPSDSFVLQPPTHIKNDSGALNIGTLAPAPEPASPRPNWLQRVPTSAASPSPSFKSRNGEDDFGFGSRILEEQATPSPVSGLTFNPNPHASNGPSGSTEEGLQGEHTMTPLSKLYIQKAQEARDRTAALRQSISRQSLSSLRPSLNAQRASQAAPPPLMSASQQHTPHTTPHTTNTTSTTSAEQPPHAPPSSLPAAPSSPSQPLSYASALSTQPPPHARTPPPPTSAASGTKSVNAAAHTGASQSPSSPTAAQASSPTSAAAAAAAATHRSPRVGSILSNLQASQQNGIPNRSSPATRVAVHSATGGNPGSPSARTASYASAAARVSGHGHPQGTAPQRSNSGRSPTANLSASKSGWKPTSFAVSGGSGSSSSSPKCAASPKAVNTPRSRNSKGGSPAGAWR